MTTEMERRISAGVVGRHGDGAHEMREALSLLAEALWARALEIGAQIDITPASFKATLILKPDDA